MVKDREKLPQPNDAAYPVMHCKERDANDCWFYYTYAVNNNTETEVHVVEKLGRQRSRGESGCGGCVFQRKLITGARGCNAAKIERLFIHGEVLRWLVFYPPPCSGYLFLFFCTCYFKLPNTALFQTALPALTSSPSWRAWSPASS